MILWVCRDVRTRDRRAKQLGYPEHIRFMVPGGPLAGSRFDAIIFESGWNAHPSNTKAQMCYEWYMCAAKTTLKPGGHELTIDAVEEVKFRGPTLD